jgi:hypothetical protein
MIRLPYEKKVYSQHHEDGILEFLVDIVQPTNRTFLEIGWGNGMTNCCRYLLQDLGFSGTGFDARESKLKHPSLTTHAKMLTLNDVEFVLGAQGLSPAVFSLDIDSFDWHLLKAMLDQGFRPSVIVHEYNSHFGPEWSYSRRYGADTVYDPKVRFGASLAAYGKLLHPYYQFVTVDSSGVNAFWIQHSYQLPAGTKTHAFNFHKGAQKNFDRGLDFLLSLDNGWEAV